MWKNNPALKLIESFYSNENKENETMDITEDTKEELSDECNTIPKDVILKEEIQKSLFNLDIYSKSLEMKSFYVNNLYDIFSSRVKEPSNSFIFEDLEESSIEMASIISKIIKLYEKFLMNFNKLYPDNSKIELYPYQLNGYGKEELDRFLLQNNIGLDLDYFSFEDLEKCQEFDDKDCIGYFSIHIHGQFFEFHINKGMCEWRPVLIKTILDEVNEEEEE
jgi:hypothetical protein